MKTKNFRDWLAFFLAVLVIPGLWVLEGVGMVNFQDGILVATLPIETLIIQFYFRKASGEQH